MSMAAQCTTNSDNTMLCVRVLTLLNEVEHSVSAARAHATSQAQRSDIVLN